MMGEVGREQREPLRKAVVGEYTVEGVAAWDWDWEGLDLEDREEDGNMLG
jgi:hypothetical protein